MSEVSQLVVAGWTGRDEAALRKHIRELEAIGVKPPKTTPIFYRRVAVGSDHTDRKAETIGVSLAKQLCAKPVSRESWRYADVKDHWEKLILRSWSDGELYQEGSVAAMRSPEDPLARYPLKAGWAMFSGTLAAKGGIRPGQVFRMELEDPVRGRKLAHEYRVEILPVEG